MKLKNNINFLKTLIIFSLFFLFSCTNIKEEEKIDSIENNIKDIKNELEELKNKSQEKDLTWDLENENLLEESIDEEKKYNSISAIEEEEIIQDIKEKFNVINFSPENYLKLTTTIFTESSWWTELTGFFNKDKDNHLDKILVKYYWDMWKWVIEYYFWENELFFVFSKDSFYNMPITFEESKIEKEEQNRYYFYDEKIIRWLWDWAILKQKDEEFFNKWEDFLNRSINYRDNIEKNWTIKY